MRRKSGPVNVRKQKMLPCEPGEELQNCRLAQGKLWLAGTQGLN